MASKHLDKARDCVKKKNYEYAVHWYLTHLKATPDDVEARKELRQAERAQKKMAGGGGGFWGKGKAKMLEMKAQSIRVNTKDPEKTMIACEDLLKTDPDNVNALIRLGEAASHAGHNEVAVQAFEDALHVDKEAKEALRLLGRVLKGMEEMEKALKCFQKLNKVDPKDKEALDAVKNIPAQMTATKVKEGVDKGGYQHLIDKDEAKKLEQANKRVRTPEEALERIGALEQELKKDKRNVKKIRLIAELYVKAEQPEEAVAWCEKALKVDPDDYLSQELKGDLILQKNRDLVAKLEDAVRKDPSQKPKLVKAKKQKLLFEIEEYSRRVEAHPTEFGLRYQLGKAFFDANKIDEAIPELQKAKADARKKADAGYLLGRCFINKKIYKLAVRELEAAHADLFEMDGLKKEIFYLLGRIFEQANKGNKAINYYEQIAESDFNYRDVTKRLESLSSL